MEVSSVPSQASNIISIDGHDISSTALRSDRICDNSCPRVTIGTVIPSFAGKRGQSSSNYFFIANLLQNVTFKIIPVTPRYSKLEESSELL